MPRADEGYAGWKVNAPLNPAIEELLLEMDAFVVNAVDDLREAIDDERERAFVAGWSRPIPRR